MIGEQTPGIVFKNGIDNTVQGHDHPQGNENIKAGKGTDQSVDGGFSGIGAHEYRTDHGGAAIGIGKPGMQGRHGGIEQKTGQDKIFGQACRLLMKTDKGNGSGLVIVEKDTAEQHQAAGHMDEKIPVTGSG